MTEEDHYCSLEGSGLTDRLNHYSDLADESEDVRLQREAVEQMRQLREEFSSGNSDQFRLVEKAKRVVDELFNAMGW